MVELGLGVRGAAVSRLGLHIKYAISQGRAAFFFSPQNGFVYCFDTCAV